MKFLSTVIALLCCYIFTACAQSPMWLDEQKNEENRLPMHATFYAFEDSKKAAVGSWEKSANYMSLNGAWKFKWVEKPADLPEKFTEKNFNDSDWGKFKIPATWEVDGYGYPVFVNIGYEFQHIMPIKPPLVPLSYDPTGVYRRVVNISKKWDGKRVIKPSMFLVVKKISQYNHTNIDR